MTTGGARKRRQERRAHLRRPEVRLSPDGETLAYRWPGRKTWLLDTSGEMVDVRLVRPGTPLHEDLEAWPRMVLEEPDEELPVELPDIRRDDDYGPKAGQLGDEA